LEAQRIEPVIPVPGYALARQSLSEQPEPPPPPGAASGDGHATTP
jgi:hypothetical protein